jgi:hypothetical protein
MKEMRGKGGKERRFTGEASQRTRYLPGYNINEI